MDTPIVEPTKIKKWRRGQPTVKQVKALQNINQGMSVRKALIEAGYSIKTANKSTLFFKAKGVQSAIMGLKMEIQNIGITNKRIAAKFNEWIDAKKKVGTKMGILEDNDYDTQIKAYDRMKDIWNADENPAGKIKRKLTIEEFVNEPIPEELKEDAPRQ
jgi:hypothetical protein